MAINSDNGLDGFGVELIGVECWEAEYTPIEFNVDGQSLVSTSFGIDTKNRKKAVGQAGVYYDEGLDASVIFVNSTLCKNSVQIIVEVGSSIVYEDEIPVPTDGSVNLLPLIFLAIYVLSKTDVRYKEIVNPGGLRSSVREFSFDGTAGSSIKQIGNQTFDPALPFDKIYLRTTFEYSETFPAEYHCILGECQITTTSFSSLEILDEKSE